MDPKKGSNYMEKAIEKASRLIDLLTKENSDLKQQNLNLQSQLDSYKQTQAQIEQDQEHNIEKIRNLEDALTQKQQKIINLTAHMGILQQKISEKSKKNKELHEKLGQYAGKNQQLLKNMEKQKKKNLSLKNENDYLLKTFNAHQAKQNQFQNCFSLAEEEFKKEIIMVDRTKQAFARKCQQLQSSNWNMRNQIAALTLKIEQLSERQAVHLHTLDKISEMEKQIKRTNDALSYIIESNLRIKAETGLYLKVEQIKNYLNYRLQHIENLVKPIADVLIASGTQTNLREIRDLQSLNSLINRFSSYLGELIK